MKAIPSLLLSALLAASLPSPAQPAAATPQTAPVKAPEPDPDPAMLKAMKSKVFEVKHRSPRWLVGSLRALGSGVRGSRLDSNDMDGFSTITVRDFPENLALIEEATKRLDTPTAVQKATDVELTLHVIFASKNSGPDLGIPEELKGVIKSLKGSLAYRSYSLGADFVQRARPRADGVGEAIEISGDIDPAALGPQYSKDASRLSVGCSMYHGITMEVQESGPAIIRMRSFRLNLREVINSEKQVIASIGTELSVKEGEKVVVGTSTIKDRGLIVVLSARRVN